MSTRKAQDPISLTEFVRQITDHQTALRGYIRSLIPHADDVRDVLQNTNLVLWERRGEFVVGSNFRAWAFTIARFRALEHRRKLKKDHRLVFDDELIHAIAEESYDRDPDLLVRRKAALLACMERLKPKDRTLLAARYASDVRLEDHAASDGRSPGSLRVILNRLRSSLRRCIDQRLAMGGGAS